MKADDVVRLIAQVTRELAPGESELVTPESVLEVLDARELALMTAFARACERHGMTRQLEWLRTVPSGGFNIHEHDIAPFQAVIAKENEGG